jgi:hypothetical protein
MFVREYARALWEDWVALMSGVASVVFAVWAAYFPPADVFAARTLLWVAAVLCFLVSSYRIWANEHRKLLEETERHTSPNPTGRIGEVYIEDTGTERQEESYLVIQVFVENHGATPVTLQQYDLEIVFEDGQTRAGHFPARPV